jgi:hypothetical protein
MGLSAAINQGSQASDDPNLFGVQLRHDGKWTPELTTSAGISWYTLKDEENLGNWRGGDHPNQVTWLSRAKQFFPAATRCNYPGGANMMAITE